MEQEDEGELTEYELQRLKRIQENNAVLAALDLHPPSCPTSSPPVKKGKNAAKRALPGDAPRRSARLRTADGGRKVLKDLSSSSGDDESQELDGEPDLVPRRDADYDPSGDEQDEDEREEKEEEDVDADEEEEEEDGDADLRPQKRRRNSGAKKGGGKIGIARRLSGAAKKLGALKDAVPKRRRRLSGGKKQGFSSEGASSVATPSQLPDEIMFVDSDDELQKALALSMGEPLSEINTESAEPLLPSSSRKRATPQDGRNPKQKRQTKKKNGNDIFLGEDEVVKYFYETFDDRMTGNITLASLKRAAEAHDFTWTDQELDHMINIFNSNKDNKLNLEEFRNITIRCNMLQLESGDAGGSDSVK